MTGGRPVVLVAGPGDSTWIVANALRARFELAAVVLEDSPSKLRMLRRRAGRLGWPTVGGQLAFLAVARLQAARAAGRVDEICKAAALDRSRPPDLTVHEVASVNAPGTPAALARLQPAVVVVNGTRIIAPEVLNAVPAPFVNIHAGFTPAYRGVHGGYWALANGDPAHFGVTVHLVDPGIDTGGVLAQATLTPGHRDNFTTYPYLQLASGVPLLLDAVAALLDGTARTVTVDLPSRLWSHPTLAGYLARRWTRGVR